MAKSPASPIDAALTLTQVSKLLDLTPQRINQLERDGWIKKKGRGQYKLSVAVQGYLKFLKDDDRRGSKTASDARLQEMRADEIELRIEQRSGALIDEARTEALAVIDEFAGGLRADLMALPARVTSDLTMRRQIEDGIDEAFGAASKRAAQAAEVPEEPDSDTLDGGGEDDAGPVGEGEPGLSDQLGEAGSS